MKKTEKDAEETFLSNVSKLVIKLFEDIILLDGWNSDSEVYEKVRSSIRDILEKEAYRARAQIKAIRTRKLRR